MRIAAGISVALWLACAAAPAQAQECTDADCQIDLSVDECADPAAGCLPERDLDEAALERAELAPLPVGDALDATAATAPVAAPVDSSAASVVVGGCSTASDGALPSLAALALIALVMLRRRRALPLVALAIVCGCVGGGDGGWDGALADGPPATAAGRFADVWLAEPGDAPAAQFAVSLQPLDGTRALRRASDDACGDRLATDGDGALVGYVATQPASGTAALTELVAPGGCGVVYETDADVIAEYVADGWAPGAVVGYVWPPGWGDPSDAATDAAADAAGDGEVATDAVKACALGRHPALFLFYTGIDHDSDFELLRGCPGEVVLGEKHTDHPRGVFTGAAAHAAGGRSAFIFGDNGRQFRDMLLRSNGVERTAAFIRKLLEAGYDYVVVDEVTTDPNWADGATVNHRFRQLLLRIPPRTLIPYISLDLTMYPGGGAALHARRFLVRALKLRARALALEEYLHTGAVMGGAAPPTFRTAANRVAAAVHGMRGAAGISAREITTLGLSMHTAYAQYNYLDDTRHDLAAVAREATAVRHASSRTRAQHGLGLYFIGKSDITPSSRYTVGELVTAIHHAMLRFR